MHPEDDRPPNIPWYREVTGYQSLVLAIASAGWVFDTFEGQLFNITRTQMLSQLLGEENASAAISWWGDLFLATFLVGGTVGGVLFGALADRFGRKPMMIVTILCYSLFSGLTALATELWQIALLRFLVALGVGGEWSVAAALVAEVLPARARSHAEGIFHATSVFGTWLAAVGGILVGDRWRWAYVIGVIPALLILWVRTGVKEPERKIDKHLPGAARGQFRDLFRTAPWRTHALLGLLLASVGLGTFWGVTVAGQDLALELLRRFGASDQEAAAKAKFAYGIVQTAGGGLGLLSFGPIAVRMGRKGAFALFHLAALFTVPLVCYGPQTLLPTSVVSAHLWIFHHGHARWLCHLFPGVVSGPIPCDWYRGVLQWRAVTRGPFALDLRRAEGPSRDRPALEHFATELVICTRLDSAAFFTGNQNRPLPE